MGRPELISTFTKIELWRQTQYRRIVYLDADMVMLRAPHELLQMQTPFAAAPDIGWPDCFNSGVMVLNPNMGDYYALLALAQRGISFDGADQGLLNMHFRDWERISFAYNCTPSGNYQYVPAYRHFQSSISGVHFIGKDKPWTLGRENHHNHGVYGELLGRWWAVYDAHYRNQSSAYFSGQSIKPSRKVQDYVHGEETRYEPGYSSAQSQSATGQQSAPSIVLHRPSDGEPPAMETPMGDAPSPAERTTDADFTPTPTVQQRKFSAPEVDWHPARSVLHTFISSVTNETQRATADTIEARGLQLSFSDL
jgi:glycogenin